MLNQRWKTVAWSPYHVQDKELQNWVADSMQIASTPKGPF
jgi:hypothetical protein